jgi:hypothetical protein
MAPKPFAAEPRVPAIANLSYPSGPQGRDAKLVPRDRTSLMIYGFYERALEVV